jgi:hypothetical protein
MNDDLRCCGTGTCIINQEGLCWCGQKWDGMKMSFPIESKSVEKSVSNESSDETSSTDDIDSVKL